MRAWEWRRPVAAVALTALGACSTAPREQPTKEVALAASLPSDGLVVRVGDGGVSAQQLLAKVDAAGAARDRYKDPRELRALLDNLVRFELLAQEAFARGLDKDPEVQEAARRAMVQKLMATVLASPDTITDAEIQASYDANILDYRQPERVQVAVLGFSDVAAATAALDRLRQGPSDALTFAKLREAAGEATNRDVELKYWSAEELTDAYGEAFANAAFVPRDLGSLGPVVSGNGKAYVFKLTGRRSAFHRPLVDVAAGIRQKLARTKRDASLEGFVNEQRKRLGVSVDEAAFTALLQQLRGGPASQPSAN